MRTPESRPSNHTEAQLCRVSLEDDAIPMSFRAARCLRVFQLPSQERLVMARLGWREDCCGIQRDACTFFVDALFCASRVDVTSTADRIGPGIGGDPLCRDPLRPSVGFDQAGSKRCVPRRLHLAKLPIRNGSGSSTRSTRQRKQPASQPNRNSTAKNASIVTHTSTQLIQVT